MFGNQVKVRGLRIELGDVGAAIRIWHHDPWKACADGC